MVNLDMSAMLGKPVPHLLVLVVGGVVLNEMDLAEKVTSEHPFQIVEIRLSVEDLLEMVEETGGIQLDGAEDFQGFLLPGRGDLRLAPDPGPDLVEGRVLPEGGFAFEEESSPFVVGFF